MNRGRIAQPLDSSVVTEPKDFDGVKRELRAQPQRPEFAVQPLRTQSPDSESTVAYRIAAGAWAAVVVVMIGLAAIIASNYDAVRGALELSVSEGNAGATSAAISDTVTVTLLGSGVVALLLVLFAGLGLSMAAASKAAGRIVLLVVGLATIGASLVFWSFMSDAGSVAAGALAWGPLVCAGCAAISTVAAAVMRVAPSRP